MGCGLCSVFQGSPYSNTHSMGTELTGEHWGTCASFVAYNLRNAQHHMI